MNWQPIETAPRDGSSVIVYSSLGNPSTVEGVLAAWFSGLDSDGNEWWYTQFGDYPILNPSHWMPLPEPPR